MPFRAVIYDTNFLIALQGRNKRLSATEAKLWIGRHETGMMYIPRIVALEFSSGFTSDAGAAQFLGLFTVLPMGEGVLSESLRVMRALHAKGQGIGAADSIIAATALRYGLPLVTDNVKHFRRIEGLDVRGFIH